MRWELADCIGLRKSRLDGGWLVDWDKLEKSLPRIGGSWNRAIFFRNGGRCAEQREECVGGGAEAAPDRTVVAIRLRRGDPASNGGVAL
ncbi:protein of unknown function [Kyrpidia spormannii]|uniref:Uncharacterized protein n=2 Tax=Kyrpidia spormannii TaxID=2055160 RepID=A0ACA8Z5V2_9BACL|nr:protein of unknown function [Kyrpidia spormannii]CAB3390736.1 protein of unknown function [Kyrpidia spormannii]